jgi:hypothetical protein
MVISKLEGQITTISKHYAPIMMCSRTKSQKNGDLNYKAVKA